MKNMLGIVALAALLAGCAATPESSFAPAADDRVYLPPSSGQTTAEAVAGPPWQPTKNRKVRAVLWGIVHNHARGKFDALRQLKDGGLIVSRREGKEVYYKAASAEQVRLLHLMMEKTMEISCPEDGDGDIRSVPELPELDAHTGGEGRYPAEQVETVRRVHELLTENLDRRYTIEELSRRFLINPSSLKETFKAVYGKSLAAHIKEHRMELASELLRGTDLSIAEISERVGYENQSKFSAEFKKQTGKLPSEYRRFLEAH